MEKKKKYRIIVFLWFLAAACDFSCAVISFMQGYLNRTGLYIVVGSLALLCGIKWMKKVTNNTQQSE